jgi:hypothetical protein
MSQMTQIKQTRSHLSEGHFILSILIIILSLWLHPKIAQAQWIDIDANLYTTTDNVGIGTANPITKFHVNVGENQNLWVRSSGGTLALDSGNDSGSAFAPLRMEASQFHLITGNVGIGTTTPGARFQVTDTSDTTNQVQIAGPSSTTLLHLGHFSDGSYIFNNYKYVNGHSTDDASKGSMGLVFDSSSLSIQSAAASATPNRTSLLTVLAGGSVGIGTTTPGTTLEVVGEGIAVDRPSGTPFLAFKGSGVNKAAIYSNNDGDLRFFSGSGSLVENVTIKNDGKVGIGTQGPSEMLHVTGNVRIDGNIVAKYQDVAEWVTSPKAMSAGTVVILHPEQTNQVLPSIKAYDTRVAGVISEMPGILLGEGGEGKVKVATTGRVKVKVDATKKPVQIGDMLVTSDKEGVAMKSEPMEINGRSFHQPGTILGKALEPLNEGEGKVLVLLSLQ